MARQTITLKLIAVEMGIVTGFERQITKVIRSGQAVGDFLIASHGEHHQIFLSLRSRSEFDRTISIPVVRRPGAYAQRTVQPRCQLILALWTGVDGLRDTGDIISNPNQHALEQLAI